MISKKYLIFISFIIFTLTNISNSNSIEPDIFVQSTVNRASQVLSDNLTKDQKIDKLKSIAEETVDIEGIGMYTFCLLYTSPSPRDATLSRMPSSA